MHIKVIVASLFIVFAFILPASGQQIKGEVVDMDKKQPVGGVSIENLYTALTISTASDGSFAIDATKDQLLEFKKPGFKTVRVRIPKGNIPSYFKIIMEHGFTAPEEVLASANRYDRHRDSIRYREVYKHELDFARLSTLGKIQHPFSAMSKRNKEIWKFQEDYDYYEKEKYVDKTFTKELITKVTGLTGDSLNRYMTQYRPSYEQLRGMSDYAFFNFIKYTVNNYRSPQKSRGAQ